jgi:polysaccharide export outer membrane protein
MPEEQLSIIDVLVMSGDLTSTARRDNIMIIRETGNEKKIKHINLEDHSVFSSPWYYVQPNDIVYVAPDDVKRTKDEKRARFQTTMAIATSTVSLLVIVLDRILR